jgi:predicted transcriptional regulator
MMSWSNGDPLVIGPQPATGTADAFRFALGQPATRVTEFAAASGVSITNASNKFKQLWEQGFLLRREQAAESGGVEYVYYRIE